MAENISCFSISDTAIQLAEVLRSENAVPKGSEEDALHIAIGAAQGADYLLTWNFKHINNAEKKLSISHAVASFGFISPQLCSPAELGGTKND